jgi:predicted SprT family Zn-dependent metalloprotease
MENVRLGIGGILKCDKYDETTKTWTRGVDATKAFLFALNYNCTLEHGLTLKDIFLLIDRVNLYDILSPMLTGGMWLQDIVKEGLTEASDDTSLDNLNVGWSGSIYNDDGAIKDLELKVDFFGSKNGETDRYALDLTPTSKINSATILLNDIIDINDESSAGFESLKQNGKFPSLLKCRRQFTLHDILHGIFWELSFHGGPKERDERFNSLVKQVDDINKGEEKTFTLEEFKAKLEAKKCKKCDGHGWLWWKELDEYDGPAIQTGEDDTKYTCDLCDGTGKNKEGDK